MKTWQRIKVLDKFEFPIEIDLYDYLEDDFKLKTSHDYCTYELFSVIIHSGSAYGGHYHTYIRDVQNIGNWLNDDVKKTQENEQEEQEIYLIRESLDDEHLDYLKYDSPKELLKAFLYEKSKYNYYKIDSLCGELSKQAGITWNKVYKQKYGPINKFLKKHNEAFELNADETQVKLKLHKCINEILSYNYENSLKEKELQQKFNESVDLNTENNTSNQIDKPVNGYCWFDFDDSRVKPIKTEKLKSQFEGKESAYMLFYRKKSLNSFKTPSIPEWIEPEINLLNENLAQQRVNHEKELNQVYLSVFLDSDLYFTDKTPLTVENVIILFDDNELKNDKFKIDKRSKKIPELKECLINYCTNSNAQIESNYPSEGRRNTILNYMLSNDQISFYVCKQTSQNLLFLSSKITTNEDVINFLKNCSPNDSLVLSANQETQNRFQVGYSYEPIKLKIKYFDKNLSPIETNDVILIKTTKISTLKEIVGSNFCINNEKSFTLITQNNKNHQFSLLDTFQNEKQLSDFGFKAGDCVCVDNLDLKAFGTPTKSKEDEIKINVLSCISSSRSSLQSLIINKADTVESVKIQIISLMGIELSCFEDCHLRYYDLAESSCRTFEAAIEYLANEMTNFNQIHSGNVLYDNELIDKLVAKLETYYVENSFLFMLCNGRAPKGPDEINIKILKNEIIIAEIISTKESHVKDLVDSLFIQLKYDEIQKSQHYLKTVNWLGDPDKILNALDKPISEYNLENNSCLALVTGQLIPLGSVKINLWKYNLSQDSNGIHDFVVKHFLDLQSYKQKFELITDFVLKSDTKIEDLKMKINELINGISEPSDEFNFRLRLLKKQLIKKSNIEVMRLKKNLIENHKTINQLNLQTNEIDLCMQELESSSGPMNQGIILLDCVEFSLTDKNYKSYKEICWNVNNGASLTSLKQSIANEFNLEQSATFQMQIAKRLIDKCDWQLIKDAQANEESKTQQKGNKKKQSGKQQQQQSSKSNLKNAPYLMDDGDLIVFSLNDANKVLINRDFFSEFDQQYHDKLKKATRNVDFFAQKDKSNTKQPRNRRPEVGITIKTDIF